MLSLQNMGLFLLLLGVLVTVHELGHFLVAKLFGVKVVRFSFGFGPKLLGFTKGETEYQIALLPLGGYVKMAGYEPHEDLAPEEAHRGFLAQPAWKRGLIALAGPAFSLLFPILIYFFVYLGPYQATSTRVGSVEPGMPAAAAGIRPGDRILKVDGAPVRTYEELMEVLVGRFNHPLPVTVEREGKELVLQVTPLRRADSNTVDTVQRGELGVSPERKMPVVGVPHGSPAWEAGLRTFDQVVAVNGQPVLDEAALYEQISKAEGVVELTVQRPRPVEVGLVQGRVPELVEVQVPRQPGEGLAAVGAELVDLYVAGVLPGSAAERVGLRAGDRLLSFEDEPLVSFRYFQVALSQKEDKPFQLTWRTAEGQERTARLAREPLTLKDEMGNEHAPKLVGVNGWRAMVGVPRDQVTMHLGAGEAMEKALLTVPYYTGLMVKVLAGIFVGDVPTTSLGGPIMMYQLASRSAEQGWDSFLQLMAIISINLGVINLVPIPILDGFNLLTAVWEGIRRRPIPVRAREVANVIGLVMLFMLMVLAFKNDLMR
jgi:regulator of sigma E protease